MGLGNPHRDSVYGYFSPAGRVGVLLPYRAVNPRKSPYYRTVRNRKEPYTFAGLLCIRGSRGVGAFQKRGRRYPHKRQGESA